MTENETRRQFVQVTSGLALAALAGCVGDGNGDNRDESMDDESMDDESMDDESMDDESMDDESMEHDTTTFRVRIENVASTDFYDTDTPTDGQIWITPGAYAVHTGQNPIYTEGEMASIGLEALAEAGPPTGFESEPGLVDELDGSTKVVASGAYTPEDTVADPNDPMGAVPGAPPIAPGGAFVFDIEAEPGQRLSFASMFVPSNDVFLSPDVDGIPLFDDDMPVEGDVTESVVLWDAGTEPNGKPGVDPDQAPAQEAPDQGADEDGSVRRLKDVDDGFEYPEADNSVQVTLTPQ
jgi:hypothetical protein